MSVDEERNSVKVEVGVGELLDKITILEIKLARISDPAKLANVRVELEALSSEAERVVGRRPPLETLKEELKRVNQTLWHVEDEIRQCEQRKEFGARFVELARTVYIENDRRAAIKRRINEASGSRIVEEKAYSARS
jgi:hypothetical protein